MNICVYGASSVKTSETYIRNTEILGEKLAQRGHSLVYGAGANGLMGAIARGFTCGGGNITGVVPDFFKVDGVLYDKCTEFISTKTMRERKRIMEERADAFIVTPGGIGTFDEFFEILTLKQLGRHNKVIAVYNIDGYYDELNNMMKKAVDENLLSEKSLALYEMFSQSDELIDYIETTRHELVMADDVKIIK